MIGASLEQLDSLSGALTQTATDITDVNAQSQSAAGDAVEQMNAIATSTKTAIEAAMTNMIDAVNRSRAELEGADWKGQNRDTFNGHYETFSSAMTSAQTNTNATFESLRSTIATMGSDIQAYAVEMQNALNSASTSTTSMSTAVTSQRSNLEAAMSGMTVG